MLFCFAGDAVKLLPKGIFSVPLLILRNRHKRRFLCFLIFSHSEEPCVCLWNIKTYRQVFMVSIFFFEIYPCGDNDLFPYHQ